MDSMSIDTKKEIFHKISFVVPCYNEDNLVCQVIDKLQKVARKSLIDFEIIIIDDGSTDNTPQVLKEYDKIDGIRIIRHKENLGKGAAIRSAVFAHTGDVLVIQDADLEYDPSDIPALLDPIIQGKADVVYGSRFMGGNPRRALYYSHALGNKFLTAFSNILSGLNLTDMETGYKVIRSSLLNNIELKEDRFGVEPELTMKLAKVKDIRFYEVGISYYGRSFQEGKKIKWTDGLYALICIIKYRFS